MKTTIILSMMFIFASICLADENDVRILKEMGLYSEKSVGASDVSLEISKKLRANKIDETWFNKQLPEHQEYVIKVLAEAERWEDPAFFKREQLKWEKEERERKARARQQAAEWEDRKENALRTHTIPR